MQSLSLSDIPYLNHNALTGRVITSLAFYVDGDWHFWMQAGERGELLFKMKAWPAESVYFAVEPESENDIYLHFIDFLAQSACWPSLMKARSGMIDDVLNLATSLDKLRAITKLREHVSHGLSRMAATEIEYVVTVCRSLFDLLQETVVKLWPSIKFVDPTLGKRKLRASFSKMVEFGGEIQTAPAIAERYAVPLALAECYANSLDVFVALRKFRDNIVHHGSQVQHIFASDDEFLIGSGLTGFPDLVPWRDDERRQNDLVPLMPAIEMLIFRTLANCEHFSRTLEGIIEFPPPVVPGMNQFLRGHSIRTLSDALVAAQGRLQVGEEKEPVPAPSKLTPPA